MPIVFPANTINFSSGLTMKCVKPQARDAIEMWGARNLKGLAFQLVLLTILFVSTSASAQLDVLLRQCRHGDQEACFPLEFGRCADENPRVAIPACTRDLARQDNRKIPANLRMGRAARYALRASAHAKQGDIDLALSDYDRAITSHRGIFWIQMRRGDAYFLAGDDEAALESYEAAVALNPESAVALIYRAMILAAAAEDNLRDPAQALEDAQRANQLDPDQPAYIDILAVAHAANGNFDKAVEETQRAISLLPPGDQNSRDDYQSRMALYRQATPFRMDP